MIIIKDQLSNQLNAKLPIASPLNIKCSELMSKLLLSKLLPIHDIIHNTRRSLSIHFVNTLIYNS